MITFKEAQQRASVHSMSMKRTTAGDIRVAYPELSGQDQERSAYYTDDTLDAALTAAAMRRSRPFNVRA